MKWLGGLHASNISMQRMSHAICRISELHVIYTAVEVFDKVSILMAAVYNVVHPSCCCFMMLIHAQFCLEHDKGICA